MQPQYPGFLVARASLPRLVLLVFFAIPATAQSIATQTVTAQLQPIGKLSTPAALALTIAGGAFTNFSGVLTLSHLVRTTSSGSGSITVQVTSDFSPAGGPSAASGNLTYSCGSASFGTPCSGTKTATTASQTQILTIPAFACTGGGGLCSNSRPNTLQVTFSVADSAAYKAGSYSSQVTFTISAT